VSASIAPWVIEVGDADFDRQVMRQSYERMVVVDFWAPWCQPCLMLAPILEKVIGQHGGSIVLAKVNTDENPTLAAEFRIEVLPTVMVFRDGKVAFQFQGLVMEEQLRELLDQLMPTEAENLVKKAAGMEEKEPAQAEALYRRAWAQDSKLDAAAIGLARVLLSQDKEAEAKKVLDNVVVGGDLAEEADKLGSLIALKQRARECGDEAAARQAVQAEPANAERRYRLGCVLAGKGDYAQALEELLAAGERDHKLLTTKVREAMVQIFHVVGNQSPLANDYRRRLSSMLY
jgi:putative thioredoxin